MINTLEYNSTRKRLMIPEYGRIIQKMAEYCVTIPDRKKRTEMAQVVVEVMALIHNMDIKKNEETLHRLWDHLYIVSNFKLDVDSPFPKPEEKSLVFHPEKPAYNIEEPGTGYRNYGKIIRHLIKEACKIDNEAERNKMALLLANHMKKFYLTWNHDIIPDEAILDHLRRFSNGCLDLPSTTILMDSEIVQAMNEKMEILAKQHADAGKNGQQGTPNGQNRQKKKKKK